MNYKALRKTTCCIIGAVSLMASPLTSVGAPVAGVASLTNVTVTNELKSSPASGISLLLSQYLAENSILGMNVARETTEAAKLRVAEAPAQAEEETVVEEEAPAEEKEEEQIAVAQVSDCVNVRAKASEDSEVLGKLYNNSVGTVIKEKDGWYKIKSGDVKGYVKGEYVVVGDQDLIKKVGTRVATVTTEKLRVRKEANTDSKIIELVPSGEDLIVEDENAAEGWVKVSVEEGEGYVSADYVTLSTVYTYAESKEAERARLEKEERERRAAAEAASRSASRGNASSSGSSSSSSSSSSGSDREYSAPSGSNGSAVANYACQFVGNPYVYGGSSLTNGTDCSGFVMSVYAAFGVSLPHSSSALRSCGYGVSQDEMQPGDIICYSGHVGIYVGNDTIVHASNRATGIKYTSPANYRRILAVRRIF